MVLLGPSSLVKYFVLFIVFGYFEMVYQAGYGVTVCLGLFSFYQYRMATIFVLAMVQYGTKLYLSNKAAYYAMFLVAGYLFVVTSLRAPAILTDSSSDMHIHFRPYEEEIRAMLFKKKPSLLHKVDSLLDEYVGREKELLSKLERKCEEAEDNSIMKSPSSKLNSPAKRLTATYSNEDIYRPGMNVSDVEHIRNAMYQARQQNQQRMSVLESDPRL